MKIGLEFPQRYYPRSFLSLLLLAFFLVAAPLIVAFYNAAVYVEQLAGQSQTAVSQAAQASRGSRLLVEQTTALVGGYMVLSDLARNVLNTSNALIDREVESMRRTGERAQRILWLQLAATIPLGILLAVGVTLLIARPIRQLDQAIRRLGAGEFEGDIRVGGPADLKYLGSRLDWLRQRLIELEQQKRLFLRHVSHELKTPLTALREGSELLAEGTAGPLSSEQREIVGILQQKSVQLQQLIEGLLNYHRAQESGGRLELTAVRFDEVVEQVLDDHRLAILARGIRADLRLDPV